MVKTLLLFDIDGTLISNSNAGIVAYLNAMKKRFDVTITQDEIPLSCGKTDFIIVRELLNYAGFRNEKENDPEFLSIYLTELKKELEVDPGTLAPGIPNLLKSLATEKEFVLALGTGNIKKGAFIKLAHHGLDKYFETGGFSEDGATRSEVIKNGARRVAEHYSIEYSKVVVIGDTPSDIKCAQDNGFYAVAVATGNFTYEELESLKPTRTFCDLADYEGFILYLKSLI